MTSIQFNILLTELADAWSRRDYRAAAEFFAENVRYLDPVRYSFENKRALLDFFEADEDQEQRVSWHSIIFNEVRQQGAAEYTYEGTQKYHGVAIVQIASGKIVLWREYQHIDARSWEAFAGLASEGS